MESLRTWRCFSPSADRVSWGKMSSMSLLTRGLGLTCLAACLSACHPAAYTHPDAKAAAAQLEPVEPLHSLLLIGDCGKPSAEGLEPSLALLGALTDSLGKDATVLFLGDNVYNYGLPPAGHPDRSEGERRLYVQLDAVRHAGTPVHMVPGNHDWAMMGAEGWDWVREEEKAVEARLGARGGFHPDGGCPGPVVVQPAPGTALVLLDTQWWLHTHDKPGKAEGCAATTEAEFLAALRDSLAAHANERLIVAAHHPLYSYGTHGGHYGWKYHLFPLLMAKKKAYVPLPVIGTLAVLYRKLRGTGQDCSHPRYRRLRKGMVAVFQAHPGLVYVAGHEHNLQHIRRDGIEYVVSGAGCKAQSLGHGRQARYTRGDKGFARIDILPDGALRLSFLLPQGGCTVDYQAELLGK